MLSEALRLIRVFHDLKQVELANKLGISKSYLSEIEHGKKTASIELIDKYSALFKIPSSSILFFSENIDSDFASSDRARKAKGIVAGKVLSFLALIESKTDISAREEL